MAAVETLRRPMKSCQSKAQGPRLKIRWGSGPVWVRLPPSAPGKSRPEGLFGRRGGAALRDRDELFREVCRLAVELGSFRLAWIGLVRDDLDHVAPVASWGDEEGYLEEVRVAARDVPLGRGPTGTAVREGRPVVCQDLARDPRMEPWRAPALRRGYRSSAALPLRSGPRVVSALSLYAAAPGFFDEETVSSWLGLPTKSPWPWTPCSTRSAPGAPRSGSPTWPPTIPSRGFPTGTFWSKFWSGPPGGSGRTGRPVCLCWRWSAWVPWLVRRGTRPGTWCSGPWRGSCGNRPRPGASWLARQTGSSPSCWSISARRRPGPGRKGSAARWRSAPSRPGAASSG